MESFPGWRETYFSPCHTSSWLVLQASQHSYSHYLGRRDIKNPSALVMTNFFALLTQTQFPWRTVLICSKFYTSCIASGWSGWIGCIPTYQCRWEGREAPSSGLMVVFALLRSSLTFWRLVTRKNSLASIMLKQKSLCLVVIV